MLLRVVEREIAGTTRLVGATGIVRRLIDLAHALDHEGHDSPRAPFPTEPSVKIAAELADGAAPNGTRPERLRQPPRASSNGKPR